MVAYFLVRRTVRVTWKGRKRKRERQAVLEQELAPCSVLKSVVCLWGLVPSGTPNPPSSLEILASKVSHVLKLLVACSSSLNKSPGFENAGRCLNRRAADVWRKVGPFPLSLGR